MKNLIDPVRRSSGGSVGLEGNDCKIGVGVLISRGLVCFKRRPRGLLADNANDGERGLHRSPVMF